MSSGDVVELNVVEVALKLLELREKYRMRMAIAREKHARALTLHRELAELYDPPNEVAVGREPTVRQFTGEGCYSVPESQEAHRLLTEWLDS